MKKCIAILLLVLLLSGCSAPGVPPAGSSSSAPSSDIPSSPAPASEIRCPLFTEAIRSNVPQKVPEAEAERLRQELERILVAKPYSAAAKTLVRNTLELLLQEYPMFQELFAFAKPYSVGDYVQIYMLTPLEYMVDNLYYACDDAPEDMAWLQQHYEDEVWFAGLTNDIEKWIAIVSYDKIYSDGHNVTKLDAGTLLHELFHAGTCCENWLVSSRMYGKLSEGGATIAKLPLLQTLYGTQFSQMHRKGAGYTDSADDSRWIELYGNHSGTYGIYASIYFKLLALTDFETMQLYFRPKGELLIRENLVARYGEDGGRIFDALQYQNVDFDRVVDTEQLFLRMFLQRLDDVSSADEMAAYLYLYRMYRKVYCARYLCNEFRTAEAGAPSASVPYEQVHPKLNYPEADALVAEAVLKWQILNPELPVEVADAVAEVLASTFIFSTPEQNSNYNMMQQSETVLLQSGTIHVQLNQGKPIFVRIGRCRYEWSEEQQRLLPVF
ncbi:MAG: hypothetical protein IJY28_09555 [Clostridia bacterium]|nr:hypothetical protein [Clostridia bacterium]